MSIRTKQERTEHQHFRYLLTRCFFSSTKFLYDSKVAEYRPRFCQFQSDRSSVTALVELWGRGSFGSKLLLKKLVAEFFFYRLSLNFTRFLKKCQNLSFLKWYPICDDSCESQWKSNQKKNIHNSDIWVKSLVPVDPCPQNSITKLLLTVIEKITLLFYQIEPLKNGTSSYAF